MASKGSRHKPNYFIAAKVTNTEINRKIDEVERIILNRQRRLKAALKSTQTLHFTVMVMHLDGDTQLERAASALDECASLIKESGVQIPTVSVNGVGKFPDSDTVLFAKLDDDEELKRFKRIAEIIVDCFTRNDIMSTERRDWHPHLTMFQIPPWLVSKGMTRIDPKAYSDLQSTFFGQQKVESLQLCSMQKERDETGYYIVSREVRLV